MRPYLFLDDLSLAWMTLLRAILGPFQFLLILKRKEINLKHVKIQFNSIFLRFNAQTQILKEFGEFKIKPNYECYLKGKLFVKEDVLLFGTRYVRSSYEPSIKYEQFKSNNDKKKK